MIFNISVMFFDTIQRLFEQNKVIIQKKVNVFLSMPFYEYVKN